MFFRVKVEEEDKVEVKMEMEIREDRGGVGCGRRR